MAANDRVGEIEIPALLRAARGAYSYAIRAQLANEGIDDLPRNGAFILGGLGNHNGSFVGLVRQLGVSKQAASQLIDALVVRGYLTRAVDATDRRRMTVDLTERGRLAAAAISTGVSLVDEDLARLISASERDGLRAGLTALAAIKERREAERH